jgi:hypothetical protein
MCWYLDEAVVEEEAYKPGLLAGGGFLHDLPHDVLRPRALVLVGIVADLKARGRAEWRASRWERIGHTGIRGWKAVAGIDWKFAGHGAEQGEEHSEKGKLGHLPSFLLGSWGLLERRWDEANLLFCMCIYSRTTGELTFAADVCWLVN